MICDKSGAPTKKQKLNPTESAKSTAAQLDRSTSSAQGEEEDDNDDDDDDVLDDGDGVSDEDDN
jgi:hypothetical protein